jgi:hypothetical protein
MFTDIVGFSRHMGADEARMLRLLEIHNRIIRQAVVEHRGTVIKTVGDAFLVDFPSVVHAVQCAQTIQTHLRTHNTEKESAEQIHIRIGIHSGDIVQKEGDVFGDGVNIASRLQELAEPDTICISDVVYRDVAQKIPLGAVVSLGRPKLKNIAQRFQVYALLSESPKGLRQGFHVQWLKFSRRVGTNVFVSVFVGVLLIAGTILTMWYLVLPTLSTQDSALRTQAQLALPTTPAGLHRACPELVEGLSLQSCTDLRNGFVLCLIVCDRHAYVLSKLVAVFRDLTHFFIDTSVVISLPALITHPGRNVLDNHERIFAPEILTSLLCF